MALTEADLQHLPPHGIDPQNPGPYETLLNDLQGNILKGHGRDYSTHLFLQFKPDCLDTVQTWIRSFAQTYLKSAQQQSNEAMIYRSTGQSGGLFANLFLSRHGYQYLEIEAYLIPGNQPFRMGMKHSEIQAYLSDPPVASWEAGFQGRLDALVVLADDEPSQLASLVAQLKEQLEPLAEIVQQDDGFLLFNERKQIIEHFGFVDGISQPLFLKRDLDRVRSQGEQGEHWDPQAPLSLILVKDPNGHTEDSYGSYLAYRKLEQNVKGFRDNQRQLADTLNLDEGLVGAMIVGRFTDGTPVTNSDHPLNADAPPNDFNFAADTAGTKCPFHAHVRKTNPRGDTGRVISSPGFEEALQVERGHRIARRAVSYGESDVSKAPETGSGLLFLCFQADIENQFNFMQSTWANPSGFVKAGVGPDPLIGQPSGTQQWPTSWNTSETQAIDFQLWITLKGGGYFFAPSLSFLKSLGLG